jgi:hypothetical protein
MQNSVDLKQTFFWFYFPLVNAVAAVHLVFNLSPKLHSWFPFQPEVHKEVAFAAYFYSGKGKIFGP